MKVGTIYKGKSEIHSIIFNRVWAMPNAWTFKIGPIKELLGRYVGDGYNWVDPFAGKNSPARTTNDHNPEMKEFYKREGQLHSTMEAVEFAKKVSHTKGFAGVIFDPPYSFRQISEHYKVIGKKAGRLDTSSNFYEKVKSVLCEKVHIGGHVISFGWNSNGFGKKRGYKIIEILLVSHGGSKNDTIVTVEQRIK